MRRLPLFLATLFAPVLVTIGPGIATAEAQTVPAAEAEAFLGDWAVALDAQGQTFMMDVNIQEAEGNVAAEVSSDMGGSSKVERISKTGENLVLRYSMDAQGQQVPVMMTLAPEGEGWNVNVDFADGMFQTSGKGTRK